MRNEVLTLRVNGQNHKIRVPRNQILLDTLRECLDLKGTWGACGIGMCGTCTVLVDGAAVSSCLMLTAQLEGRHITTIEGLSQNGQLHPVQQAYIDHGAFQCAYCTPGFILSTVALLNEYENPDDVTIRSYLAGNLCRCGSYVNILKAVRSCLPIDDQSHSV